MYTMCVTEKTAEQQVIFEQTFLQMLLEDNYDDITISDLCRRAGLSRKIFYRLFERKSDVLHALIDHTLLEEETFVPDESVGSGELHRFFAFWQTKKDLLDVLLAQQTSSLLAERGLRMALKEHANFLHFFGADESAYGYEMMAYYTSGIFSLLLLWHSQGYRRSIDEMSALLMQMLTTPAMKNPWIG